MSNDSFEIKEGEGFREDQGIEDRSEINEFDEYYVEGESSGTFKEIKLAEPEMKVVHRPVSSIEFDEMVHELKRGSRKTKLVIAGIVLGVVLLLVLGFIFFSDRGIADRVKEEMGEEIPKVIGAPEWVELEMVDVKLVSEPEGAFVVVNGVLQEGLVTPCTVKFVKNRPNFVSLYKDSYISQHLWVEASEVGSQGVSMQLLEVPAWEPKPVKEAKKGVKGNEQAVESVEEVDPRFAKVLVKSKTGEDDGADVWFDGKYVGKLPVEVEGVLRRDRHHVLMKKEGKSPYVAIFDVFSDIDQISVSLGSGVYIDRSTDIWVEPSPKDSTVLLGSESIKGSITKLSSKGEIVPVKVSYAEYEPWQAVIHTTGAGHFYIRPTLSRPNEGKSLVHWRIPEGKYWYPCLKRPKLSVCWDSLKLRHPKEIASGEYEVIFWEQLSGDIKDKRWAKNKIQFKFEAGKAYSFDVDLTGEEVVLKENVAPYSSENPEGVYKRLKIVVPKVE